MTMIVVVSTMLAFVPATLGQLDENEENQKIRTKLSFRMEIKAQNAYKMWQSL